MGATVDGINAVTIRLKALASPQRLRPAMELAGAHVEGEAKKKAQRFKNTGDLSRSIQYITDASGMKCTIFTPLEYAPYVEYGTGIHAEHGNGRKDVPWTYKSDKPDKNGKDQYFKTYGQYPQPYLRPALKESRRAVKNIIQKELLR